GVQLIRCQGSPSTRTNEIQVPLGRITSTRSTKRREKRNRGKADIDSWNHEYECITDVDTSPKKAEPRQSRYEFTKSWICEATSQECVTVTSADAESRVVTLPAFFPQGFLEV